MANRVIAGVLVVLVLAAAAAGVFAYRFSGQIDALAGEIDSLSGELAALRGEQDEQLERVASVSNALAAHDEEATTRLGSFDALLQASFDRIAACALGIARPAMMMSVTSSACMGGIKSSGAGSKSNVTVVVSMRAAFTSVTRRPQPMRR